MTLLLLPPYITLLLRGVVLIGTHPLIELLKNSSWRSTPNFDFPPRPFLGYVNSVEELLTTFHELLYEGDGYREFVVSMREVMTDIYAYRIYERPACNGW